VKRLVLEAIETWGKAGPLDVAQVASFVCSLQGVDLEALCADLDAKWPSLKLGRRLRDGVHEYVRRILREQRTVGNLRLYPVGETIVAVEEGEEPENYRVLVKNYRHLWQTLRVRDVRRFVQLHERTAAYHSAEAERWRRVLEECERAGLSDDDLVASALTEERLAQILGPSPMLEQMLAVV